MTRRLLRGRILTFNREPEGPEDTGSFDYIEDGALIVADGMIETVGSFSDVSRSAGDIEQIDHCPHLMMAGFIDTHLHFPQTQIIASWGAQLIDWLNTYTFPEETRYADESHSQRMAEKFLNQLVSHGTTTAAAFCSVHKQSADALFASAERRNMRMIAGKVLMDRNAPDGLRDTPDAGYEDSKALIDKWHRRGRALYAITPRFAITSTPEQLSLAGALVAEHPECYVQSHLSENLDEIALTAELYPAARDYLDVYESHGLLGPKTLLGHAIHLKDREVTALAETGTHPIFCPTSNLFLGSGLFDDARMRAQGISNGIATDVGGGTSYSMLQTLNEGYKVLHLLGQNLHPFRAFHWVTRGNAEVLGLEDKIGTLDVGTEADIVVLDANATEAMAMRMERVETLAEELFVLQIMGDDRAIAETYVNGEPQKSRQETSGQFPAVDASKR